MAPSRSEAAVAAALNGVCGDHLEATRNSLAIPMRFTTPQDVLACTTDRLQAALPQVSPHVVVLVDGHCLSEWSWSREEEGDILGDFLVGLGSASGAHPDELKQLNIRSGNYRIFHETNHFDLPSDEGVHQQVVDWLSV